MFVQSNLDVILFASYLGSNLWNTRRLRKHIMFTLEENTWNLYLVKVELKELKVKANFSHKI